LTSHRDACYHSALVVAKLLDIGWLRHPKLLTHDRQLAMRTTEEIAAYYEIIKADDMFGFRGEVLLSYLSIEQLRPFLKAGADMSDWVPDPLDKTKALRDMREYMEFAWGKARDHRGLSAGRSIEKMEAWLWLLEQDDILAEVRKTLYPSYGAPKLKLICELMGFPIPDGEDLDRMSRSLPCREGCVAGCGL